MRGQHHDVAKQQQELLQILGLTLVLELFVLSDTDNGLIHDLPFGFLPSTFPVKPSLCRKYIYICMIYIVISRTCGCPAWLISMVQLPHEQVQDQGVLVVPKGRAAPEGGW